MELDVLGYIFVLTARWVSALRAWRHVEVNGKYERDLITLWIKRSQAIKLQFRLLHP